MTPYLFAYGTLMSTATGRLGRGQRERLRLEAVGLGAASISGRLYDLGRYPGLADAVADTDIVHGEVFQLAQPQQSLAWLDAYEGIVPGDHTDGEYARVVRPALLATGDAIEAWVYRLNRIDADLQLLATGRWT